MNIISNSNPIPIDNQTLIQCHGIEIKVDEQNQRGTITIRGHEYHVTVFDGDRQKSGLNSEQIKKITEITAAILLKKELLKEESSGEKFSIDPSGVTVLTQQQKKYLHKETGDNSAKDTTHDYHQLEEIVSGSRESSEDGETESESGRSSDDGLGAGSEVKVSKRSSELSASLSDRLKEFKNKVNPLDKQNPRGKNLRTIKPQSNDALSKEEEKKRWEDRKEFLMFSFKGSPKNPLLDRKQPRRRVESSSTQENQKISTSENIEEDFNFENIRGNSEDEVHPLNEDDLASIKDLSPDSREFIETNPLNPLKEKNPISTAEGFGLQDVYPDLESTDEVSPEPTEEVSQQRTPTVEVPTQEKPKNSDYNTKQELITGLLKVANTALAGVAAFVNTSLNTQIQNTEQIKETGGIFSSILSEESKNDESNTTIANTNKSQDNNKINPNASEIDGINPNASEIDGINVTEAFSG